MTTWIGALARGGLLIGDEEEEGALLALRVLGEERLSKLREHFASQRAEVVARERRGAIHACIFMAQADRRIAAEEIELLTQIIARSDLGAAAKKELAHAIEEPQSAEWIADEVTEPGLRELILALGWQLANSDGRLDPAEQRAHRALSDAFGVGEARSVEIAQLVERH
jgi:tellurite resistance protein